MKFQRFERYEPVVMTPRRQSAFGRKQEKERARYPLFPDQIAAQQIDLGVSHASRSSSAHTLRPRERACVAGQPCRFSPDFMTPAPRS